jgi:predicted chitinase
MPLTPEEQQELAQLQAELGPSAMPEQLIQLDFSQQQTPSPARLDFERKIAAKQVDPVVSGMQNRSTTEDVIKTKLVESGITDPKEIAQFLATAKVESNFKFKPENLSAYKNTSTSRIKSIFETKIKKLNLSDADIDELKKEPEKLFDILYGNIGGSKYRGRGPLQITGIKNYELISNRLFGDDRLVQNPELLEDPETSIKASIEFWKINNLGEVGKQKGFDEVQRLINVGPKGSLSRVQELNKRRKFYNKYLLGGK